MKEKQGKQKMGTQSKIIIALVAVIVCIIAFFALNGTLNFARSADQYADDSAPTQEFPDVKDYIASHLDSSKAGSVSDAEGLIDAGQNFFFSYLLVDQNTVANGTTIDELWFGESPGEKVLGLYNSWSYVYKTSDDAEYWVAFVDSSMIDNTALTYLDHSFTELNLNGEKVDGLVYDQNTGIVYIPKKLYFDENGNAISHDMQQEIMFGVDYESMKTETYVTVENNLRDVTAPFHYQIIESSGFNTITYINIATPETAANLTYENIGIYINGEPVSVSSDNIEYDSTTGVLGIGYSSITVATIKVVLSDEQASILPRAEAFNTWTDMGTLSVDDSVYQGKFFTYYVEDIQYNTCAAWAYSRGTTGPYEYIDVKDIANIRDAVEGTDQLYAEWLNLRSQYNANLVDFMFSVPYGYGISGWQYGSLAAFCGHHTVGSSWNVRDAGQGYYYSGDVHARVLELNRDAGYIVMGFVCPEFGAQSGAAVYQFKIESKATIQIQKQSTVPFGDGTAESNQTTLDPDVYSLQGAVYGVYTDQACTNCVGTTTTDANGNASIRVTSGKTYYVKEIVAPTHFELDSTVYAVNNGSSIASGQTYAIDVKEQPIKYNIKLIVDYGAVDNEGQSLEQSSTVEAYAGAFNVPNEWKIAPYDREYYDYSGRHNEFYLDSSYTKLYSDGTSTTQMYIDGNTTLYAYNTVKTEFYVDGEDTPCYIGDETDATHHAAGVKLCYEMTASDKFMTAATSAATKANTSKFCGWYAAAPARGETPSAITSVTINGEGETAVNHVHRFYAYNTVNVEFYADLGVDNNYQNLGVNQQECKKYILTDTIHYGQTLTATDINAAVAACTREGCYAFHHWYWTYDGGWGYSDEISDSALADYTITQNTVLYGWNEIEVDFAFTERAKYLIAHNGFKSSTIDLDDPANVEYLYNPAYKQVTNDIDTATYLPETCYYYYGQNFIDPDQCTENDYYIDADIVRSYSKSKWFSNANPSDVNKTIQKDPQLTQNCTAYLHLEKFGYDGVVGTD